MDRVTVISAGNFPLYGNVRRYNGRDRDIVMEERKPTSRLEGSTVGI
jgi:hypothetical protein